MDDKNDKQGIWKRFREWNPSLKVRLLIIVGVLAVAGAVFFAFPDMPAAALRVITISCIVLAAVFSSRSGSGEGRRQDGAEARNEPTAVAATASELFPHPPYPRLAFGLASFAAYPAIVATIPFAATERQYEPACIVLTAVVVLAGICGLWFAARFFPALASNKAGIAPATERDAKRIAVKLKVWPIVAVSSVISPCLAVLAIWLTFFL